MMRPVRLHLVRHGKASAGFAEESDPGLDEVGREQAERLAEELAPIGPLPLVVSPLKRTRMTAAPLVRRWGAPSRIEPRVAEVPSPSELAARSEWLAALMASRWSEQPAALRQWRGAVVDALKEIEADAVVVSHFIAINVAVGSATGADEVVSFAPDNCSVTVLERRDGELGVVALGRERTTEVL